MNNAKIIIYCIILNWTRRKLWKTKSSFYTMWREYMSRWSAWRRI